MKHNKKERLCCILMILIAMLCIAAVKAQPVKKAAETDRKLIEKYLDQVNLELVADDVPKEKLRDTDFINGLLDDMHSRYNTGKVSYSPDHKFKMIILEGESCGGNCTPMYSGFMLLTSGKRIAIAVDFLPVTHIYLLGNDKYLVLQAGLGGGGNLVYNVIKANVIEVKGQAIFKSRMIGSLHLYPGDEFSFYIEQNQSVSDEINLHQEPQFSFDPQTKMLSYQYIRRKPNLSSETPGPVSFYKCTGYLIFKNGEMEFQKENALLLKRK